VLSGIFLGGGGAPPSTVPISQAPQGSWVGQSGSRGYALAGYTWGSDLASLPGASLSLSQGSRYVWSASSTDSRVLQSPDQANRRAATYYDPNEIRSVLTFTAAYSGNLHLYALDWGSWGRRETITVGGRTAYLSGDFNQGAWLTFPISVPAGGSVTIKVDNTGPINAVLGGIFLGDAGAPPSGPQLASSFVNSVGVNVHASYFDTAYANSSVWENELVKLGVHNVRDMACVGCTQQNQVLMNLAGVGIKTDFIMRWPGSPDSIGSLVSMLDGPMFPAVASIEGPNEYDTSGNANWVSDLRSYQQSLYQQAKATTKLSTVPVLGPSLVSSQDASALGNLGSWLDQGNMHPYPGGQLPLANVPFNEQAETSVEQGKPLTASETGYNNALASTGGNLPVSETAAAAYVPRTFLDHFRDGITRTYLYELADEKPDSGLTNQEQHFGLLRNDLSEKPAFGTLQALLSSVAPTTSTAFAPSGLNYQLAQGPSDLRQLLLQTGPSSYALVLWRDVSVWNTSTGQDLTVVPQPVNLSFGQTVTSLTSRQLDAGGFTPLSVPAIGQPAALSVGAMPVVVRITTG